MTTQKANEPPKAKTTAEESITAPLGTGTPASINEPVGSTLGANAPTEPPPEETPVLTAINPESVPVGSGTFALTVTGSGFDDECVIVFNDEDMDTTLVSATELTADAVPVQAAAATVDVEVARGEDLSEAVTFDFTAAAGRSSEKKSQRKPSKGKRDKAKVKSKKR